VARFNYAPLATKALSLVERFGREVTMLKYSETPADAAAPWEGPADGTATSVTVSAVFEEDESRDDADAVRRGRQTCYVAADATTEDLATFNKMNDGGELREVHSVRVIQPGPRKVLYVVEVSR